jgi:hypothetical protein
VEAPIPIGPDGGNLPHNDRCASCRSSCTTLHVAQTYGLPPKPVYACVDRELCKQIMIFESMIANIRSA